MMKLAIAAAVALATNGAFADVVPSPSGHAFARGYAAVVGGPHGQWVRLSAKLEGSTVWIYQGLETDDLVHGIAGAGAVVLKDASGRQLVRFDLGSVAIPHKNPGRFRQVDFAPIARAISPEIAAKVTSIECYPVVTDEPGGWFGIILDAAKIVAVVVSST